MVVSNAKSPLRNRSRRASFCFSSVVVIRESYYSEIHNGPDCDRSVEIPEISYDVSLGKIVMSMWSGTATLKHHTSYNSASQSYLKIVRFGISISIKLYGSVSTIVPSSFLIFSHMASAYSATLLDSPTIFLYVG